GAMAGGSQQTVATLAAVTAAAEALVKELLRVAGNDSPLAGLRPGDVVAVDSGLAQASDRSRHESYASILSRAGRDAVEVEEKAPLPLEMLKYS
ncbi:hypothetical protein, partial [Clostridium perfringens]